MCRGDESEAAPGQAKPGWDEDTAAGLSGAVDTIRSHVPRLRCWETN